MRGFTRQLLALTVCAVAIGGQALAAPAPASEPAPARFTINECPAGVTATNEAEDQRLVDSAFAAMGTSGFPGITIYLPRLRAAMGRAPACFPAIERVGARTLVRSADPQEYLTISGAIAAALPPGQHAEIAQAPNTYIQVSFILGAYANEQQHYEEGLAWLERGLALQPHDQYLILEKVAALIALVQVALDDPEMALTLDRARFLRVYGVILIDLERLDDAEAALTESVRLQPNNPGARRELEYIAQLRAGASTRQTTIGTPYASPPQTQ